MLYSDCLLHTYIEEIWPTVLMLTRASINIGMFSLHDHRFHTPQNKRVSHFHWWIVNDKNSWKRTIWFIKKSSCFTTLPCPLRLENEKKSTNWPTISKRRRDWPWVSDDEILNIWCYRQCIIYLFSRCI